MTPIECKLAERPAGNDLRGLARLEDFYGSQAIAHGFVACTTNQPYDLTAGITARSGWTAWDLPAASGKK